jgi:hypothetical protein
VFTDQPSHADIVEGIYHYACCRLNIVHYIGPVCLPAPEKQFVAKYPLMPIEYRLPTDKNVIYSHGLIMLSGR